MGNSESAHNGSTVKKSSNELATTAAAAACVPPHQLPIVESLTASRVVTAIRQFTDVAVSPRSQPPTTVSTALEVANTYAKSTTTRPLQDTVHYTVAATSSKVDAFLFNPALVRLIAIGSSLSITPSLTRVHFTDTQDSAGDKELRAIFAQVALCGISLQMDAFTLERRLTFANTIEANTREEVLQPAQALALALSVYLIQSYVAETTHEAFTADVKQWFATPPRLLLIGMLRGKTSAEAYELKGDLNYWLSTAFGERQRGIGSYITNIGADTCTLNKSRNALSTSTSEAPKRARDYSAMVK